MGVCGVPHVPRAKERSTFLVVDIYPQKILLVFYLFIFIFSLILIQGINMDLLTIKIFWIFIATFQSNYLWEELITIIFLNNNEL